MGVAVAVGAGIFSVGAQAAAFRQPGRDHRLPDRRHRVRRSRDVLPPNSLR